jgi:hypothetical protein
MSLGSEHHLDQDDTQSDEETPLEQVVEGRDSPEFENAINANQNMFFSLI